MGTCQHAATHLEHIISFLFTAHDIGAREKYAQPARFFCSRSHILINTLATTKFSFKKSLAMRQKSVSRYPLALFGASPFSMVDESLSLGFIPIPQPQPNQTVEGELSRASLHFVKNFVNIFNFSSLRIETVVSKKVNSWPYGIAQTAEFMSEMRTSILMYG